MVNLNTINTILKNFKVNSECFRFTEFQSGHINDTYLVATNDNSQYVLQRINTNVFKNIDSVIKNKKLLNTYFNKRIDSLNYDFVNFIETYNNSIAFKDESGNYWNLMTFIEDSKTFDVADNKDIVFEAGKLYGDFVKQTSQIDAQSFSETIEDFHSVPSRFLKFEDALKTTKVSITEIEDILNYILESKNEMCKLSKLIEAKTIPLRLTHNDTKLSNILFNSNNKGLAVIDLDTVMPGIIHFDFGDSIRSICSTAKEDEQDLSLVTINLEFYKSFCDGYSIYTKDILSEVEIKYLPLAVKTMIFIMGLRFFTDYLNGNIYYKVSYQNHNLIRAKNQFALLKDVSDKFDQITDITNNYFSK